MFVIPWNTLVTCMRCWPSQTLSQDQNPEYRARKVKHRAEQGSCYTVNRNLTRRETDRQSDSEPHSTQPPQALSPLCGLKPRSLCSPQSGCVYQKRVVFTFIFLLPCLFSCVILSPVRLQVFVRKIKSSFLLEKGEGCGGRFECCVR